MEFDFSKIRKYEFNLNDGTAKSDGPEDHRNMIEAMQMMLALKASNPPQTAPLPQSNPSPTKGLKLLEVLDKMFLLKSQHKPATVIAYKNAVNEFASFLKNPLINDIMRSDVTRFQEFLATKGNTPRTIDNKVSCLRSIFNFAKKHSYYFEENPAALKTLTTKSERAALGYAFFEEDELKEVFKPEYLQAFKEKDPDFYWAILLALITGMRSSEITSLEVNQIKDTPPHIQLRDSKTIAGIRQVPIPAHIHTALKQFAIGKTAKQKLFRYQAINGRGTGNAVGKKFTRHLQALNCRERLVFHSLRKFFNNYMLDNDIAIEARCQMVGHEINNVNVSVYTKKININKMSADVNEIQQKILELIQYPTEM